MKLKTLKCPGVMMTRVLVIVLFASVPFSAAAETYAQAIADPKGRLRIVTEDGRDIVPPKEKDQVGYQMPVISPDHQTVGWLALYPNCCTSYPIPLRLVIYNVGRIRTFIGNGLPVWRWCFLDGGKQVAFEQETVHGGIGVHYELRDVVSGRLMTEYDPGPDEEAAPPSWVEVLNKNQ